MTVHRRDNKSQAKLVPISPLSVVRLVRWDKNAPSSKKDQGRIFRVGYYSRQDGLDCVWLVNDEGEYEQTVNHGYLYLYFDIVSFADHVNWFGRRRPQIASIRPADCRMRQKGKLAKKKG